MYSDIRITQYQYIGWTDYMSRNIGSDDTLKNLGVMIPETKKTSFKTICTSRNKDMREVIESYVDKVIENPSILEAQK